MSNLPSEFFTLQSVGTLTGATGLCFVITNGLRTAFGFDPRWLGLLVAEIVALGGAALAGGTVLHYVLAVPNGFLIFSTAAGAASMTSPNTRATGEIGFVGAPSPKRFLGGWF